MAADGGWKGGGERVNKTAEYAAVLFCHYKSRCVDWINNDQVDEHTIISHRVIYPIQVKTAESHYLVVYMLFCAPSRFLITCFESAEFRWTMMEHFFPNLLLSMCTHRSRALKFSKQDPREHGIFFGFFCSEKRNRLIIRTELVTAIFNTITPLMWLPVIDGNLNNLLSFHDDSDIGAAVATRNKNKTKKNSDTNTSYSERLRFLAVISYRWRIACALVRRAMTFSIGHEYAPYNNHYGVHIGIW